MTLPILLKIVTNPYGTEHSGPIHDAKFFALLADLVSTVGRHIEKGHEEDPAAFPRPDFAITMMNPTAPVSTPSQEAVLFTATFGENGADFLPNAAAKAYITRDRGVEVGQAVYTARHLLACGDFRYGFAPTTLRGIYIGGSGQTEATDLKVCTGLGMRFDTAVNAEIADWEQHQRPGRWFSDDNRPAQRYLDVHDLPGTVIKL